MLMTLIIAAIRKIGRGFKLTALAYTEASELSFAARKIYPFSGL